MKWTRAYTVSGTLGRAEAEIAKSWMRWASTSCCTGCSGTRTATWCPYWNWTDLDARGGHAARELSLWVQLQCEFRARSLLGVEAVRRHAETPGRYRLRVGVNVDNGERQLMRSLGRVL
jgi:hypothetical protein